MNQKIPYSPAIAAGPFLFVSGQLPSNLQAPIAEATHQVIDHLETILAAHDLTLADVVRVEVFLADINDLQAMNAAYQERFNSPNPPARQTIQAAALPKGAPLEISCIAYKN